MPQRKAANSTSATAARLITSSTAWPKPRVTASTWRLNQPKNPRCGGGLGLSTRGNMAGVSVSATKPDTVTETTIVIANCLYSWPVVPGRKAAGMNTDAITSTTATSELAISFIDLIVASLGARWWSCMLRSTFSTTTMASSTTIPIASTRPNRVMRLIEKPSASMPANVAISETMIAIVQMIVVRKLCRNRYTTSTTSAIASNSVWITSSIDSLMKSLVSSETR